MLFARWVFAIAGVYGLLVLAPQCFLEQQVGRDNPPPIAHPEFFYGFLGVALAWQVAFLIIATDPSRYRPLMIASALEKFSFALATGWLFAAERIPALLLGFGGIDLLLGSLFLVSFALCPREVKGNG